MTLEMTNNFETNYNKLDENFINSKQYEENMNMLRECNGIQEIDTKNQDNDNQNSMVSSYTNYNQSDNLNILKYLSIPMILSYYINSIIILKKITVYKIDELCSNSDIWILCLINIISNLVILLQNKLVNPYIENIIITITKIAILTINIYILSTNNCLDSNELSGILYIFTTQIIFDIYTVILSCLSIIELVNITNSNKKSLESIIV